MKKEFNGLEINIMNIYENYIKIKKYLLMNFN